MASVRDRMKKLNVTKNEIHAAVETASNLAQQRAEILENRATAYKAPPAAPASQSTYQNRVYRQTHIASIDPRISWHYMIMYGGERHDIPASQGFVFVITKVCEKNALRDVKVKVVRFRSVESAMMHYMRSSETPTDSDVVEELTVCGMLPTTSSSMILTASNVTYGGARGKNATVFINGHSSCSMQPIPLTKTKACEYLDCTIEQLHEVMHYYGMSDAAHHAVVPCEILAMWSQHMLYTIDAEFDMPVLDDEINTRHNIINPLWNYGATLAALRKRNEYRTEPHPLVVDRLAPVASPGKLNPNAERNGESTRLNEHQDCRWNIHDPVMVADTLSKENNPGVAQAELDKRAVQFEHVLTLLDYMMFPMKSICNLFYVQNFKTNSRAANDTELQEIHSLIDNYMLRVATLQQLKHAEKLRKSSVGIGRGARAAFMEQTAALEYMSVETIYLLSQVVLHDTWKLCILSLLRSTVKMNRAAEWREMTLCELVRVTLVLGLPPIPEHVKTAISLYQMQLSSALNGFTRKDLYIPMQVIMDNAKMRNFVTETKAALDFLVEHRVVIIDDDRCTTRLAAAEYQRRKHEFDHEKAFAKRLKIKIPPIHAENDQRVQIRFVHEQEKQMIHQITMTMIRGLVRFPFIPFDEYFKQPGNSLTKFGYKLDNFQREVIDILCRQETALDAVQIITGLPGTGKSLLIAILVMLAGAMRKHITVCAVANKATNNIRDIIAAAPFHITTDTDGITFYNLSKFAKSNRPDVRAARTNCEVLIIDEFSTADMPLILSVLRVIKPKLMVCVGDPNQLGAIQYGNLMGAFIGAGVRVHNVHTVYRSAIESQIMNKNAHSIIRDPYNAFSHKNFIAAHCRTPEAFRQAMKFNINTVLTTDELREKVKWDRAAIANFGDEAVCYKRLKEIDSAAAEMMLIQHSPCVFIDRASDELTVLNRKCKSITPIVKTLQESVNASETNTRAISMLNASCNAINFDMQTMYRTNLLNTETQNVRVAAFNESLKIKSEDLGDAAPELSLDMFTTAQPDNDYEAIPSALNRSLVPLFPSDTIVIKQNFPARRHSIEVNNGDIFKIDRIVDVQFSRADPRPKNHEQPPDMASDAGSGLYPPSLHSIHRQPIGSWYNASVPHSFSPLPQGYARFLYFTTGEYISFPDFRKNTINLAYCLTTFSSQGSEYDNIIVVITEADTKSAMANRHTILVAITRAKRRLIIVGSREEAQNITRVGPQVPYDVFEFKLMAMLSNHGAKIQDIKVNHQRLCVPALVQELVRDPYVLDSDEYIDELKDRLEKYKNVEPVVTEVTGSKRPLPIECFKYTPTQKPQVKSETVVNGNIPGHVTIEEIGQGDVDIFAEIDAAIERHKKAKMEHTAST